MVDSVNHHRRSIRFHDFDYASEGGYFVTIVSHHRLSLFGEVADGVMKLNLFGRIVWEEWFNSIKLRPNINLLEDEFVVMPNHVHGIVWIVEKMVNKNNNHLPTVGAYCNTPLRSTSFSTMPSPSQTVGAIIRGFKGSVTKRVHILRNNFSEPVWQRNYYEHIISSERDYLNISEYIANNPLGWEMDKENIQDPN